MPAPVRDRTALLDVTREEAWVVHSALMEQLRADAAGDGDPDGDAVEVDALERLERSPVQFTPDEARAVREALVEYLAHAPPRDRAPGRAALRTTESVLG
ncbi:DUF7853 family protein [Halorarum salinum]|uniref:Uncharacterized protein n=1 Tax=Halorarum salinum TaxID=2743089 RepID=A0A7D5L8S4_9EURY|nr:hypothetical protein [Halobaculum salinum]QLG60630.1 hypothetical protein HUG12_02265 [Halobaculum salinum]